jgi:hypothetical protein
VISFQPVAQNPPPQNRPRRRRRLWLGIGALIGTLAAAAIAFVALRDTSGESPASTKITFEVFGSAATPPSIDWAWRAPGGRIEDSLTASSLPWSKTVEINDREGLLFVNATAPSLPGKGSPLGCRITVNGTVADADDAGAPDWGARCETTLQRALKASTSAKTQR